MKKTKKLNSIVFLHRRLTLKVQFGHFLTARHHKVDKTEGADQFSDMDFQFLALWAAQGSK